MSCKICKKEIENFPCRFCGYDNSDVKNPHYLMPGYELLGGKYVVGQVVGAGGFGVTYSAWDTLLDRHVAVKEYMPGEFSTRMPGVSQITIYSGEKEKQFKDGMLKFHDESNRLAKFTEVPGIVQIYDCFYENNTAYIVMEYLEGETLEERIEREGKIPVEEAIGIMTAVLDALEVVHKEKIIHRDIAPNNIFLTKDGKVKLLDFGAARTATGSHSKSLTVLYKEGYTAEEQYRSSGDQGPWTDVYSAAATFYKAVTGITPDGAMERRLKDELKPIGKCGIKVSSQVEKAVMNALNVSAKKRTQTAGHFKQELTGEKTAKNKYERTREREVGRFPIPVMVFSALAAMAVVALIVLQQLGYLTFTAELFGNMFVPEGKVRMINVVNMDIDEATEELERLGLNLEVSDTFYREDVPAGIIVSQSTDKGKIIDIGTTILVGVNEKVAEEEVVEETTPRLIRSERSDGTFITYEYDNAGRMVRRNYSSGIADVYEYDSDGNLSRFIYDVGEYGPYYDEIDYQYDSSGNIIYKTDGFGYSISYEWDTDGNLKNYTMESLMDDLVLKDYQFDEYGNFSFLSFDGPFGFWYVLPPEHRIGKHDVFIDEDIDSDMSFEYEYHENGVMRTNNLVLKVYDDSTTLMTLEYSAVYDLYGNEIYSDCIGSSKYFDISEGDERIYTTNYYSDGTVTSYE